MSQREPTSQAAPAAQQISATHASHASAPVGGPQVTAPALPPLPPGAPAEPPVPPVPEVPATPAEPLAPPRLHRHCHQEEPSGEQVSKPLGPPSHTQWRFFPGSQIWPPEPPTPVPAEPLIPFEPPEPLLPPVAHWHSSNPEPSATHDWAPSERPSQAHACVLPGSHALADVGFASDSEEH